MFCSCCRVTLETEIKLWIVYIAYAARQNKENTRFLSCFGFAVWTWKINGKKKKIVGQHCFLWLFTITNNGGQAFFSSVLGQNFQIPSHDYFWKDVFKIVYSNTVFMWWNPGFPATAPGTFYPWKRDQPEKKTPWERLPKGDRFESLRMLRYRS